MQTRNNKAEEASVNILNSLVSTWDLDNKHGLGKKEIVRVIHPRLYGRKLTLLQVLNLFSLMFAGHGMLLNISSFRFLPYALVIQRQPLAVL